VAIKGQPGDRGDDGSQGVHGSSIHWLEQTKVSSAVSLERELAKFFDKQANGK
jgi:hypothetical protein